MASNPAGLRRVHFGPDVTHQLKDFVPSAGDALGGPQTAKQAVTAAATGTTVMSRSKTYLPAPTVPLPTRPADIQVDSFAGLHDVLLASLEPGTQVTTTALEKAVQEYEPALMEGLSFFKSLEAETDRGKELDRGADLLKKTLASLDERDRPVLSWDYFRRFTADLALSLDLSIPQALKLATQYAADAVRGPNATAEFEPISSTFRKHLMRCQDIHFQERLSLLRCINLALSVQQNQSPDTSAEEESANQNLLLQLQSRMLEQDLPGTVITMLESSCDGKLRPKTIDFESESPRAIEERYRHEYHEVYERFEILSAGFACFLPGAMWQKDANVALHARAFTVLLQNDYGCRGVRRSTEVPLRAIGQQIVFSLASVSALPDSLAYIRGVSNSDDDQKDTDTVIKVQEAMEAALNEAGGSTEPLVILVINLAGLCRSELRGGNNVGEILDMISLADELGALRDLVGMIDSLRENKTSTSWHYVQYRLLCRDVFQKQWATMVRYLDDTQFQSEAETYVRLFDIVYKECGQACDAFWESQATVNCYTIFVKRLRILLDDGDVLTVLLSTIATICQTALSVDAVVTWILQPSYFFPGSSFEELSLWQVMILVLRRSLTHASLPRIDRTVDPALDILGQIFGFLDWDRLGELIQEMAELRTEIDDPLLHSLGAVQRRLFNSQTNEDNVGTEDDYPGAPGKGTHISQLLASLLQRSLATNRGTRALRCLQALTDLLPMLYGQTMLSLGSTGLMPKVSGSYDNLVVVDDGGLGKVVALDIEQGSFSCTLQFLYLVNRMIRLWIMERQDKASQMYVDSGEGSSRGSKRARLVDDYNEGLIRRAVIGGVAHLILPSWTVWSFSTLSQRYQVASACVDILEQLSTTPQSIRRGSEIIAEFDYTVEYHASVHTFIQDLLANATALWSYFQGSMREVEADDAQSMIEKVCVILTTQLRRRSLDHHLLRILSQSFVRLKSSVGDPTNVVLADAAGGDAMDAYEDYIQVTAAVPTLLAHETTPSAITCTLNLMREICIVAAESMNSSLSLRSLIGFSDRHRSLLFKRLTDSAESLDVKRDIANFVSTVIDLQPEFGLFMIDSKRSTGAVTFGSKGGSALTLTPSKKEDSTTSEKDALHESMPMSVFMAYLSQMADMDNYTWDEYKYLLACLNILVSLWRFGTPYVHIITAVKENYPLWKLLSKYVEKARGLLEERPQETFELLSQVYSLVGLEIYYYIGEVDAEFSDLCVKLMDCAWVVDTADMGFYLEEHCAQQFADALAVFALNCLTSQNDKLQRRCCQHLGALATVADISKDVFGVIVTRSYASNAFDDTPGEFREHLIPSPTPNSALLEESCLAHHTYFLATILRDDEGFVRSCEKSEHLKSTSRQAFVEILRQPNYESRLPPEVISTAYTALIADLSHVMRRSTRSSSGGARWLAEEAMADSQMAGSIFARVVSSLLHHWLPAIFSVLADADNGKGANGVKKPSALGPAEDLSTHPEHRKLVHVFESSIHLLTKVISFSQLRSVGTHELPQAEFKALTLAATELFSNLMAMDRSQTSLALTVQNLMASLALTQNSCAELATGDAIPSMALSLHDAIKRNFIARQQQQLSQGQGGSTATVDGYASVVGASTLMGSTAPMTVQNRDLYIVPYTQISQANDYHLLWCKLLDILSLMLETLGELHDFVSTAVKVLDLFRWQVVYSLQHFSRSRTAVTLRHASEVRLISVFVLQLSRHYRAWRLKSASGSDENDADAIINLTRMAAHKYAYLVSRDYLLVQHTRAVTHFEKSMAAKEHTYAEPAISTAPGGKSGHAAATTHLELTEAGDLHTSRSVDRRSSIISLPRSDSVSGSATAASAAAQRKTTTRNRLVSAVESHLVQCVFNVVAMLGQLTPGLPQVVLDPPAYSFIVHMGAKQREAGVPLFKSLLTFQILSWTLLQRRRSLAGIVDITGDEGDGDCVRRGPSDSNDDDDRSGAKDIEDDRQSIRSVLSEDVNTSLAREARDSYAPWSAKDLIVCLETSLFIGIAHCHYFAIVEPDRREEAVNDQERILDVILAAVMSEDSHIPGAPRLSLFSRAMLAQIQSLR
eukprot:Clim_evm5s25 gene=Clim_evmTU5s25